MKVKGNSIDGTAKANKMLQKKKIEKEEGKRRAGKKVEGWRSAM